MRHSYWIVFAIITVFSGAHAEADSVLDNFELPRDLAATVTELYGQSAIFRAQCDRLGQTPNLRVSMRFDSNMRSSCRAFSIIRRRGSSLCVEIHVPFASAMLTELIGHEFEHVLEQVENLNLRALSHVRGSGVYEVERDLFETERAQRAGRAVAEEARARRERRPSAN
jgi:hypothetical protein